MKERQTTGLGHLGFFFGLAWVFANAVGFGAYPAVDLAVGGAMSRTMHSIFGNQETNVNDILIGAMVGILQGLILRWRASRVGLWVLATVVGLVVFSYAGNAVSNAINRLGFTVGGAAIGVFTRAHLFSPCPNRGFKDHFCEPSNTP